MAAWQLGWQTSETHTEGSASPQFSSPWCQAQDPDGRLKFVSEEVAPRMISRERTKRTPRTSFSRRTGEDGREGGKPSLALEQTRPFDHDRNFRETVEAALESPGTVPLSGREDEYSCSARYGTLLQELELSRVPDTSRLLLPAVKTAERHVMTDLTLG